MRVAYDWNAQRVRKVMGRVATHTMLDSARRMHGCVMEVYSVPAIRWRLAFEHGFGAD